MAHVEIPPEKRNPWIMLLTYDRHEPYETDSRGYFQDIVEIMYYLKNSNVLGWQDNPIGNTRPAKAINDLFETKRWEIMVKELKENNLSTKLIDGVEKEYESVNVPLLYLYLKEQLKQYGKKDVPVNVLQRIENIKSKYSQEFDTVATLIGGFMGYENLRKSCLGKTLNQHSSKNTIQENEKAMDVADSAAESSMEHISTPNISDWEKAFNGLVLKGKWKTTRQEQLELFKKVFMQNGEMETLNQAIINNDFDLFKNCFEAFEDKLVKKRLIELFEHMRTHFAITKGKSSQMQLNL
jgi:hypothetical protein